MADREIPIFCYWNGCIKDGADGPYFEGSTLRVIRVNRKTKFAKLLDELYRTTGFDKQRFQLELIGKYPTVVQPTMVKYIRLPVVDDTSVETMLEIPSRHPSISNVELYLEAKPASNDATDHVPCSSPLGNSSRGPRTNENSLRKRRNGQSSSQQEATGINLSLTQEPVDSRRDNLFGDMLTNDRLFGDEDNFDGDYDISGDTDEDMGNEDVNLHRLSDLVTNLSRDQVLEGKSSNKHSSNDVSVNESRPSSQAMAWKLERELREGRIFHDREELRQVVKSYTIKRHREFEVKEASKIKWIVKCKRQKATGCKWFLKAIKSRKHGLFVITKYNGPHTCPAVEPDRFLKQIDWVMLADEIESLVKAEPSIRIADLIERAKEKFGHTVGYSKMRNAKKLATKRIFGDWDQSFKSLPKFMAALQKSNGTIVEWLIEHSSDPKIAYFRRLFWAFSQSVEGFTHCRPVISIDSVDLKGKYCGKLIIAVGIDANDQNFPLAFAIAEEESIDCWRWFLSCIRRKVTQRRGICLISSPHSDILSAVQEPGSQWQEPWAYHRFCLKHICSKFEEQFQDRHLKDLLYKAGTAHNPEKFDAYLREFERSKPEAWQWLDSIPASQWALAHDGGMRYGIMTTNLTELSDTLLEGACDLPIMSCVQLTFDKLERLFDVQRATANESLSKGDVCTPHIMAKLQSYMSKANTFNVTPFDLVRGVFEISRMMSLGDLPQTGTKKHVVQLNQGSCTCGKWQIFKFPCSHVLAVCSRLGLSSWQFIEEHYTVEKHSRTWVAQFNPVPEEQDWPESDIPTLLPHPSSRRSKRGRRCLYKSLHVESETGGCRQSKKKKACRLCGEVGHTPRNCGLKTK